MSRGPRLTDIACLVVVERPLAVCVEDGSREPCPFGGTRPKRTWLPRSQIEINDDGTITMPERLAIEKGLV